MNIGLNRKTIYLASRRPNVSIWMYKLCKSPPYREQHISNHHRDSIQVQIVPVYWDVITYRHSPLQIFCYGTNSNGRIMKITRLVCIIIGC